MGCYTQSQHALVSLYTVADELGIEVGVDPATDRRLLRYIEFASAQLQNDIGRDLTYKEVTEKVGATYGQRNLVVAKNLPLVEIISIELDDTTIDVAEYFIDDEAIGSIRRKNRSWTPTDVVARGMMGNQYPQEVLNDYEVVYTGGYVTEMQVTSTQPRTLPYDIENVVIQLVKAQHANSSSQVNPNAQSVKTGELAVSYFGKGNSQAQKEYEDVVARYKHHILLG